MKNIISVLSVIAAFFVATPAYALELINLEGKAQSVTIIEGDREKVYTLDADESIEDICNRGCTLKLKNGDEYELKGDEVAVLEEGKVFKEISEDGAPEQGDGVQSTEEPSDQSERPVK